jgi:hypothetical protein
MGKPNAGNAALSRGESGGVSRDLCSVRGAFGVSINFWRGRRLHGSTSCRGLRIPAFIRCVYGAVARLWSENKVLRLLVGFLSLCSTCSLVMLTIRFSCAAIVNRRRDGIEKVISRLEVAVGRLKTGDWKIRPIRQEASSTAFMIPKSPDGCPRKSSKG